MPTMKIEPGKLYFLDRQHPEFRRFLGEHARAASKPAAALRWVDRKVRYIRARCRDEHPDGGFTFDIEEGDSGQYADGADPAGFRMTWGSTTDDTEAFPAIVVLPEDCAGIHETPPNG